jgi:hypothetical protein
MSALVMEERRRDIICWKFGMPPFLGMKRLHDRLQCLILSGSCRQIAHTINPNVDLLSSSCQVVYTNDLLLLTEDAASKLSSKHPIY